MFIEKSRSLQVSEKFFELLDNKLKNKNIDGQHQTFNNCREHGLILSIYDEKNSINIWACECRDSDQIMVVVGGDDEKNINNMWSDKAWENAEYFDVDDYDSAVAYAYKIIKLNFKDKMKEVNYRFELYKSMEDIERYDNDLDAIGDDPITFASYVDIAEELCCDLEIRDNAWCLTYHKIIGADEYEDLIDVQIEPNLKSETDLMLQMKYSLEDFIEQELQYQATIGDPKI